MAGRSGQDQRKPVFQHDGVQLGRQPSTRATDRLGPLLWALRSRPDGPSKSCCRARCTTVDPDQPTRAAPPVRPVAARRRRAPARPCRSSALRACRRCARGPNRSGRVRQLQHSLVTNSQPSSTCREGSLQLPRGAGMCGAIRAHCASVSCMIRFAQRADRPPL